MPASPVEPSPSSAALSAPTSGRSARDENFPVASILISPALRPHVMRFYAFARAADDIADAPGVPPADKLALLDALETALVSGETRALDPNLTAIARDLRRSLRQMGMSQQYPLQLLAAFRQDATKTRYASWAELMGYCALSANPVGRYLLELHDEGYETFPAGDVLCSALQILNHLQDCQNDYRKLDRVYLPQDWLAEAGIGVDALDGGKASPALRQVLDRCLDGCQRLLREAASLPLEATNVRLAAETETIISLAWRLTRRLRRQDPLAGRVKLSRMDFALAAAHGLAGAFFRPLISHWRTFR